MKKYWTYIFWPLVFSLGWLALKWYRLPNVEHGQMAPNFKAVTISGDTFELAKQRGKLVLIDFWGSWCGPCRQANRQLVRWHQQFPQERFMIVSIGIETNEQAWKEAIAKDGLNWPTHISSLERFSDTLALLYGVKEIPSTFLVDEKGQLIAVNAPSHQLEQTIRQKLARN
jgi:thiol-disulfide isomerase/thioredoxin